MPKCFETITRQTYQNLEIILVDDGSTDGSESLCDELAETDSRTQVVHHPIQRGLWASRNSGQRIAKGAYFLFVDGDDYLHLEAIEAMYKAINSGFRYDFAMIDRKKTDILEEDVSSGCDKLQTSELSQDELFFNMFEHEDKTLFIYQWNKLYRRELIEDLYCQDYQKAQDFDFNFRVFLRVKKAIWIHRSLYFSVQRPGSLCNNPRAWEVYYKCKTAMLFSNYVELPKDKQKIQHYLLANLYQHIFSLLNNRWQTGERDFYRKKCLYIESVLRRDFWNDKGFPLSVKIKWTMHIWLIRIPALMTYTDSIRKLLRIDNYGVD